MTILTIALLILFALSRVFDVLLTIEGLFVLNIVLVEQDAGWRIAEANKLLRPLFEREMFWAVWLIQAAGVALVSLACTFYQGQHIPWAAVAIAGFVNLPSWVIVITNWRLNQQVKEIP